jgi:hypothetical protein
MLALEWRAARLEAVRHLRSRASGLVAEGRADTAAALYRRAIEIDPEISRLHAELADALERAGRHAEAAASLERAVALSHGSEADLHRERLARLELAHGRSERAVALFRELTAGGRRDDLADELNEAEEKLRLAMLPDEYRQLLDGTRPLDRGGLAAIIAMAWDWDQGDEASTGRKLVIRDLGGHWAGRYIRMVVDRGVMSVYRDHTFRPDEPVNRGGLAHTACILLGPVAAEDSDQAPVISDLSRDHRHGACVRRLVGLGLLERYPDNTVRINDPAAGTEAVSLMAAIRRLTDS